MLAIDLSGSYKRCSVFPDFYVFPPLRMNSAIKRFLCGPPTFSSHTATPLLYTDNNDSVLLKTQKMCFWVRHIQCPRHLVMNPHLLQHELHLPFCKHYSGERANLSSNNTGTCNQQQVKRTEPFEVGGTCFWVSHTSQTSSISVSPPSQDTIKF